MLDEILDVDIKNMLMGLIHIDESMIKGDANSEYCAVTETSNYVYKLSKSSITDQDNFVIGLTTVIVDITDDIRSQKNIACQSCSLNNSMNEHNDPLFILDDLGTILFVNNSFCDLTEYTEIQLLDSCIYDIIADDSIKTLDLNTRKWESTISLKCKNGAKTVYLKIVPVINNRKQGMFSCGVITTEA